MSILRLPLRVFSLIILFALIACQPKAQTPSPLSATLQDLVGTVTIKAPESSDFVKATADSVLQENGSVQTGDDGRVRLDLSTGTIIRMSPSSLFTLVSNQESNGGLLTQLKLQAGRIFIILKGGSMDVDTPSGVASVRGSYLSVEVDPTTGDVYVTCLEGHCSANNPAGSIDLTNGQKTILFHFDPNTGNYTAPGLEDMSPEDFQNWLDENPEAQNIINQAYATLTAMAPIPTSTPVPDNTDQTTTDNTQNTGGGSGCSVIGPLGGSQLPKYGAVTFSWNPQDGATKYVVTIHYPDGSTATFDTSDTNITRYAESMHGGGDYSWDVVGVDDSGNQLCQSQTQSFSKLESSPDKPPKENKCTPANAQTDNPEGRCWCNLDDPYNMPGYCSSFVEGYSGQ